MKWSYQGLVVPLLLLVCCTQLVGVAGCKAKPNTAFAPPEYSSLLKALTKKAEIYSGLDTVLLASATYQNWPLRQAYVEKYVTDHRLTQAEKQKLLEEQKKEQAQGYEFIVATFTDNKRWDGIDREDSIWSVYLVNDEGLRVKPLYIKRQKPVSIYISEYYPYFSPWKKVYKILFPASVPDQTTPLITEQTKTITLEFASTMGKLALNWDL
jgi:hypothetical protein